MIRKKILFVVILLILCFIVSMGLIGCRGFFEEYEYRPSVSSYE